MLLIHPSLVRGVMELRNAIHKSSTFTLVICSHLLARAPPGAHPPTPGFNICIQYFWPELLFAFPLSTFSAVWDLLAVVGLRVIGIGFLYLVFGTTSTSRCTLSCFQFCGIRHGRSHAAWRGRDGEH